VLDLFGSSSVHAFTGFTVGLLIRGTMIESVEKLTGRIARIVLSDGTRLTVDARQPDWVKISSTNAAIRKVETDLLGQEAKAMASCALYYEKH